MNHKNKNRNVNRLKFGKWIVIVLAVLLLTAVIAGLFYSADYYKALPELDLKNVITDEIDVKVNKNEAVYRTEKSGKETGLIFYPGGKVEAAAYEPLLKQLASDGVTCILVEMPFHLAVFHQDAAQEVIDRHPEIQTWYLAGHSLGGAMAASFVSKHPDNIKGLILLAAYPIKELPENFPVLSIYGDQDQVLNKERYHAGISTVKNLEEVVLSGGNHAQFGNYGVQKGDGTALITPEEQWEITANAMKKFIENE